MSNLKLAFILEVVDRATRPIKNVRDKLGALPGGLRGLNERLRALRVTRGCGRRPNGWR